MTGRLVDPSLEFGLETSNHNENDNDNHGKRRSSVSGVILNLGHEIQRVPDLVVNEAKKVIIQKLFLYELCSMEFNDYLKNYITSISICFQLCLGRQKHEYIACH